MYDYSVFRSSSQYYVDSSDYSHAALSSASAYVQVVDASASSAFASSMFVVAFVNCVCVFVLACLV